MYQVRYLIYTIITVSSNYIHQSLTSSLHKEGGILVGLSILRGHKVPVEFHNIVFTVYNSLSFSRSVIAGGKVLWEYDNIVLGTPIDHWRLTFVTVRI